MILKRLGQRIVETASLSLKQSAELNRATAAGKVSALGWIRGSLAIWGYNIRHFWNPEPDPAHNVGEILSRR